MAPDPVKPAGGHLIEDAKEAFVKFEKGAEAVAHEIAVDLGTKAEGETDSAIELSLEFTEKFMHDAAVVVEKVEHDAAEAVHKVEVALEEALAPVEGAAETSAEIATEIIAGASHDLAEKLHLVSHEAAADEPVAVVVEEIVVAVADDKPDAVEPAEAAEEATDDGDVKLKTAPIDYRFPTTNQANHCFTRYVEYHKCISKEDDEEVCGKFKRWYQSLCPTEWVEKWDEQREEGTFSGPKFKR